MRPVVKLFKLGRMPYLKALSIQQVLFDKLKNEINDSKSINPNKNTTIIHQSIDRFPRNSLLLVEHEPVYTIGIRTGQYGDDYFERLKSQLKLHKLKADFVKTNRGGLITFHGPGQLVAYPILYLGDFSQTIKSKSIRIYVNILETTIINTLAQVGIQGAHTVKEYPGVWLSNGDRKIAFIGISCKRFVTMHGISINCDCDLNWFDHIISCGIEDKTITSVQHELTSLSKINFRYVERTSCNQLSQDNYSNSVDYVSKAFCASFSRNFNCDLVACDFNSVFNHLNSGESTIGCATLLK